MARIMSARVVTTTVRDAPTHDGAGPWRVAGSALPGEGAAVRYDGARGGAGVEMSDEEAERLKALGYIQE